MKSKILLCLILILALLVGVGFASATDTDYNHDGTVNELDTIDQIHDTIDIGDYNHDGKVDVTDTIDKMSDTITNPDDEKVDTSDTINQIDNSTNTVNQIDNTTDNKNNTDTSNENHTNTSDNLTSNTIEQDIELKNKVSNDSSQKIYVKELKEYMTLEEIKQHCQNLRKRTVVTPFDIRCYDLRFEAIRLENKYLYNSTKDYDFLTDLQKIEDIRFKYYLVSFGLVFAVDKTPPYIISKFTKLITNKTYDDYTTELLDYLFSAKPRKVEQEQVSPTLSAKPIPVEQVLVKPKSNFIDTAITAGKYLWHKIFG